MDLVNGKAGAYSKQEWGHSGVKQYSMISDTGALKAGPPPPLSGQLFNCGCKAAPWSY